LGPRWLQLLSRDLGLQLVSFCTLFFLMFPNHNHNHVVVFSPHTFASFQSATCVPNDYLIPALAPAWEGDYVCPYWAERWELRTRPLGCQVSTITSLTALVAGSGTLVVALLLWLLVVVVRRLRRVRWYSIPSWRFTTLLRRSQSPSPSEEAPETPAAATATTPPIDNEQTPLLSGIR
jgi:hypothetical protein